MTTREGFIMEPGKTKRDNRLAGHEASTINIKDGARNVGGFVAS